VIRSLLIANRGEIAVRIIRACRALGIRAVVAHTVVDRESVAVREADDAFAIGDYLDADAIVEVAQRANVDAVHPGYGFLAERTALVDRCEASGIIFVGPSRSCIALMGSKIDAKQIVEHLGVPTVPGYADDDQTLGRLRQEAERIGYPLLIKASAGGGGRGMRRVDTARDFAEALDTARREAQSAFGDESVLLERVVARPRHIEVQLIGDKHGHLVHLFERECSIQRQFQKIIEEAPAAHLPAASREQLHDAAVAIGRSIEYDSLGTVEFIVEADTGAFYFLEMNTRLQVEHPVTEAVTGLDLVALQIRIAGGEALPFTQHDVRLVGWAIEARVNAEDPAHRHQPQVGDIRILRLPVGEHIRIDTGIAVGSAVTPHYDSLLAKVIAFGSDRDLAVRRLTDALRRLVIGGVATNVGFLRDLLERPELSDEPLTTDYIDRVYPDGWRQTTAPGAWDLAIGAALFVAYHDARATADPWHVLRGWRLGGESCATVVRLAPTDGGTPAIARVVGRRGVYRVTIGDTMWDYHLRETPGGFLVEDEGCERLCLTAIDARLVAYWVDGTSRSFRVLDGEDASSALDGAEGPTAGEVVLRAPLPGIITHIRTGAGMSVRRGEELILMEAMKLVHRLEAPADGRVRAVHCQTGMVVRSGAALLEIAS
jgi:3-methylcrotonyl-CoA carboxylase alpha subunit